MDKERVSVGAPLDGNFSGFQAGYRAGLSSFNGIERGLPASLGANDKLSIGRDRIRRGPEPGPLRRDRSGSAPLKVLDIVTERMTSLARRKHDPLAVGKEGA